MPPTLEKNTNCEIPITGTLSDKVAYIKPLLQSGDLDSIFDFLQASSERDGSLHNAVTALHHCVRDYKDVISAEDLLQLLLGLKNRYPKEAIHSIQWLLKGYFQISALDKESLNHPNGFVPEEKKVSIESLRLNDRNFESNLRTLLGIKEAVSGVQSQVQEDVAVVVEKPVRDLESELQRILVYPLINELAIRNFKQFWGTLTLEEMQEVYVLLKKRNSQFESTAKALESKGFFEDYRNLGNMLPEQFRSMIYSRHPELMSLKA